MKVFYTDVIEKFENSNCRKYKFLAYDCKLSISVLLKILKEKIVILIFDHLK